MLNQKSSAIRRFDDEMLEPPAPGISLAMLLRQLEALVEGLSDRQYMQKPVGVVESSIGAHVRHCLDHVAALLGSVSTGNLDYDARRRGTDIESNRFAAMELMRQLDTGVLQLTPDDLNRRIILSVLMAAGQPPMRVHTSVGRELAFVQSHTIHHNALVGAMVKTLGGRLPERFGYAPSTVAHLDQKVCPSCVR